MLLKRYLGNPILEPNPKNWWEGVGVFNPAVLKLKKFYLFYRSIPFPLQRYINDYVKISVIGVAKGKNPFEFKDRKLYFGPEYHWEAYGVEDPRISIINNEIYLTYTAVSKYPPTPEKVKLAIAKIDKDLEYKKLGLICPYNSKAGVLLPKKYDGKYGMIFTLYPDIPPSRMLLVFFDSFKDLKDREFWDNIVRYPDLEYSSILLQGNDRNKFVEVGSNLLYLEEIGYIMFIPDIIYRNGNFYSFRISLMVLDYYDPKKVLYVSKPLLIPTMVYETSGSSYPTTDITFPTSAIEYGNKILVYYGASDKYIGLAYIEKDKLINHLKNALSS